MTGLVIDLVFKVTVVLGVGLTTLALLRRQSASLRSGIATATIVSALLLPAAAALVPGWPVDVPWPAPAARDFVPSAAGHRDPTRAASPVVVGLPAAAMAPTTRRAAGGGLDRLDPIASPASAPIAAGGGAPPARWPWPTTVFALWAGVAAVILLRIAATHVAARRLARDARHPVPADWREAVDRIAVDLGLRRQVAIVSRDDVSVPLVVGGLSPVLVVPDEAREWPAALRDDVIRHELAHVARLDAAGQAAGQLACALYWFHPLAWIVAARAAMLREQACDDAVIRAGTRASTYAERLVDLVRQGRGAAVPAALSIAGRTELHVRVHSLLDPRGRREPLSMAGRTSVALVTALVVFPLAAIRPAGADAIVADSPLGPLVQRPQATPPGALCTGDIQRRSNSSSDDDGRRRWRVEIEGRGCELVLRAEGRIEFNDEFTDITRVTDGGYVTIDVTTGGVRRELDLRTGGGGLTRTFRVDGRERPWDFEAQRWFAGFLIELDRQTAIGIDHRFPRLLKQGVAAVLAETALMPSDYVRYRYHERLIDEARLSASDRRQVLEQAATMGSSDYYGAELLKKVVAQGRLDDERERALVVSMIERFDSDFYRSEAITALGPGSLTEAQLTAILKVIGSMDSDFYKAETLRKVMPTGTLSAPQRALVVSVLDGLDSDFYIAETLERLADRDVLANTDILAALAKIDSDYYRGEVIATLLDGRNVREADLLAAVTAIEAMDSDHYKSESLQRVLASRGVTDRVRAAVDRAAQDLSSVYRRRIR
jgi:beta-lactamase regulating signal transducer with metallopeptidase domain